MSDSPAKKLDFQSTADKENVYKPIVGIPDMPEVDMSIKPTVAPTIKEEEADEPLLQENPQRFVLFPIKYHDVSLCVPEPWCNTLRTMEYVDMN
jgi:ribonucleoside-diphosphate reductase subunit M2